MYKKILKKVSAIVMAASIFSLIGCSSIDENQAADVENLLKDKYSQDFKVTHIGGRYGTANNDTVTTYAHPVGQENVVFQAVMNKEGELVADGYIPRIIGDQLNGILKQELEAIGIESETFTFIMKANSSSEESTQISLEEYVTKYQPGYFSAHTIVKDTGSITGEQFEKALNAVYQAGLNTTFQIGVRVISQDEFDACLEEFKKLPEVTSSWFRDYNVVDEIEAVVDGNGYHYVQSSSTGSSTGGE